MPLYKFPNNSDLVQIKPTSFATEKDLQTLFENNLDTLLGVKFISSEFTTGDRQRGRIDTLGLDQDGSPTIIEYKKNSKENVINQGLFYLDWLVDHKGDFTIAANEKLGNGLNIDWSQPRVILVAESFSDYDKYAVNRIGANIDLWTYHKYGDEYIYLEQQYSSNPQRKPKTTIVPAAEDKESPPVLYTIEDHLQGKTKSIKRIFTLLQESILSLAEEGEIVEKPNKMYIGYKHGKNFCEIRLQTNAVKIWLDISHNEINDPKSIVRDVSLIGHYGTGDVEFHIQVEEELEYAMKLIEQSYRQTI